MINRKIHKKGTEFTSSYTIYWVIAIFVIIIIGLIYFGGKAGLLNKAKEMIFSSGDSALEDLKKQKESVSREASDPAKLLHKQLYDIFKKGVSNAPCQDFIELADSGEGYGVRINYDSQKNLVLDLVSTGKDAVAGTIYDTYTVPNAKACVVGLKKEVNQAYYDTWISPEKQNDCYKFGKCDSTFSVIDDMTINDGKILIAGKAADFMMPVKGKVFVYFPGDNNVCFIPTDDNIDATKKCEISDDYLDDECRWHMLLLPKKCTYTTVKSFGAVTLVDENKK